MKISMIKMPGGVLAPASDIESEKMQKFKTNGLYEFEVPLRRNPAFHRKVFAFFNFCFQFWKGSNEFQSESRQFDVFRSNLTVLAGFYDSFYNIDGGVRIEAKSLAFSSMSKEEFEECYNALIQASMKHIFKSTDQNTYNQLLSFF